MLDDAVNYVKALRHQVEVISLLILIMCVYLNMTHFLIELTCCYYHINAHKMMSAQGGAIFQAPFMSPREYQSTQVPQFCPYVPISPKLGMGIGFGSGMVNMYCSAGHPMISSAPSESLHPSLAAGVGLPLMSASRNLAVSQMQMP